MYCFVKNYSRNISTISVGFEATKAFGDVLVSLFNEKLIGSFNLMKYISV